jgi:hypothetical protein
MLVFNLGAGVGCDKPDWLLDETMEPFSASGKSAIVLRLCRSH